MTHQPVFLGFHRRHPEVAVGLLLDLLDGLTGLTRKNFVEAVAHLDNFLGFDADVGCLAAHPAAGLVEQKAGIGQTVAVSHRRGNEDQCPGAGDPAGADNFDFRLHEANHIVNGIAGFDVTALGIDKQLDVFIGLKKKQKVLLADLFGDFLINLAANHQGAAFEKTVEAVFLFAVFLAVVVGIKIGHHKGISPDFAGALIGARNI